MTLIVILMVIVMVIVIVIVIGPSPAIPPEIAAIPSRDRSDSFQRSLPSRRVCTSRSRPDRFTSTDPMELQINSTDHDLDQISYTLGTDHDHDLPDLLHICHTSSISMEI